MSESKQTTSPQSQAFLRWFRLITLLVVFGWLVFYVYQNATDPNSKHPFKLGLDLAGGSHLVYQADVSKIDPADVPQLMNVLRDVIDRRVNVFGVSEPVVQVESSSFVTDQPEQRLVVELPGVTDIGEAIKQIGQTPLLEFKLYDETIAAEQNALESLDSLTTAASSSGEDGHSGISNAEVNGNTVTKQDPFVDTGLTGRYLRSARLGFAGGQAGNLANEPLVEVQFTEEGAALFTQITKEHVGEQLGIFLDGQLLSAPVINEPITGGKATISGNFTPDGARALAQNLSFGALPVPIELVSTQTIDATLGAGIVQQRIMAGLLGFVLIAIFMIIWYRVPGLLASFALISYLVLSLAVFQLVPVTLTAAGLAGLVSSIGIAVDANVLVFERLKEELRAGKGSHEAIQEGFRRAWLATRDSNLTGLISAVILFWFGTSMIKGFALILAIGIVISMISAIMVTRTLLMVLPDVKRSDSGIWPYLLGTGLTKK